MTKLFMPSVHLPPEPIQEEWGLLFKVYNQHQLVICEFSLASPNLLHWLFNQLSFSVDTEELHF